ncbi:MAG: adenylate/guanylate cyclase domain-containing protein [Alphaproteobacteria bacterium]|nr:adenylate/guanylate cyclase domain-containing protein [Alphaproteobacteria bacterium]
MSEERVQRRLAAILAADVVGYSRLMGADEAGTLARLKQLRRDVFDPHTEEFGGRLFKTTGDGLLIEFPSAVDAVNHAVAVQHALAAANADVSDNQQLAFRIGISLGDVIVDGDDLYGNGVNVAARMEGLAEPGGICISGNVFEHVETAVDVMFDDLGPQEVKNIALPVRSYRVHQHDHHVAPIASDHHPLAESDKPSVAILPFDNMSGDPEQEYFSDGMTEDIITALSKHRWLRVIARNSTFGYKGKALDVRQIGSELGANYVVEGSVRRSGQRLRITAQLIDAASGDHLWAERYDRSLEDIFDLQDEITDTIVGSIEPELGAAERHRVARKPRTNLQAWDCYHLGISHFYKFTAEGNLEAQRLLKRSSELDPDFGDAYAWWAYAVVLGMIYWDTEPDEALLEEALAATHRALEIDDQNAVYYALMARTNLARRDYAAALSGNEMAIKLNPTFAVAYCSLGDSLAYEGRYEESIGQFEKAIALSPNDPQRWAFLTYGALALIFKRDFETALEWTEKASVVPNHQYWTHAHMAVALAYLERPKEADQAVARLLTENPKFSHAFAEKKLFYIKRPEQLALYLDGLRKAGVPEN